MADSMTRCFYVEKIDGKVSHSITQRPVSELPPGEVTVRVQYSSLNYKDALAAGAHPGVVRKLPHVPGIDAAGEVVESSDARFTPGQQVIATSYEIGAERWGGWSELLRVPGDWVLPLPQGMTTRDAMVLGTAGITAALSVAALEEHGVSPDRGEVVVTGATGGVGSLAVMLLGKLGYKVVAVTGKPEHEPQLRKWGAARVIGREELLSPAEKPLLSVQYAGGIDTVGGLMLSTLLRRTDHYGCVAACGLVGGTDLPISVHPFILRGVTLSGISTAWTPRPRREEIWNRLAGSWKLDIPATAVRSVGLEEVTAEVERILAGQMTGRVVVEPQR
jgi:putative YhdH/YhfP family quinone oxidoreductase